jgi:hypothetical protein
MKTLWILAAAATFAACHNRSSDQTGAAPDRGDTASVKSGYDTTKTTTPVDTSMAKPDTSNHTMPQTDTTSTTVPQNPAPTYDTTSTSAPSAGKADTTSMNPAPSTGATTDTTMAPSMSHDSASTSPTTPSDSSSQR